MNWRSFFHFALTGRTPVLMVGAGLLASISLLVEVLGGKEGVGPLQVSGVALTVAILATRQPMESATANRRHRALKEYLDLRLDELESAGRRRRNNRFFAELSFFGTYWLLVVSVCDLDSEKGGIFGF